MTLPPRQRGAPGWIRRAHRERFQAVAAPFAAQSSAARPALSGAPARRASRLRPRRPACRHLRARIERFQALAAPFAGWPSAARPARLRLAPARRARRRPRPERSASRRFRTRVEAFPAPAASFARPRRAARQAHSGLAALRRGAARPPRRAVRIHGGPRHPASFYQRFVWSFSCHASRAQAALPPFRRPVGVSPGSGPAVAGRASGRERVSAATKPW